MKKLIFLCLAGISVVGLLSFKFGDDKSSGNLGDVKYSILPPDQFVEQNGKGWVLMDDKVPVRGSAIQSCCGINEIPDARGVFIRSINLNRGDGHGDVDLNRLVGSFQEDALQEHNHHNRVEKHNGDASLIDDWMRPGQNGDHNGSCFEWNTGSVQGANAVAETRPRNIVLYLYIKIN